MMCAVTSMMRSPANMQISCTMVIVDTSVQTTSSILHWISLAE